MIALVVGWYGHLNIGDEAFRPAMQWLLGPDVTIDFADYVPAEVNDRYDLLVFGGGSFLDQPIKTEIEASDVRIPIAFVGVGIDQVARENVAWLDAARLVVARNRTDLEGVITAPDLAFSRKLFQSPERFLPDLERDTWCRPKLVVLPNGFLVPNSHSPAWKVRANDQFELRMANYLARYQQQGWGISIQPMMAATDPHLIPHDDRVAGMRLLTLSDTAGITCRTTAISEAELRQEIETADLVISCRLHGCVFATMASVPFIGVGSHDKFTQYFAELGLKNYVDYYFFDETTADQAVAAAPTALELQEITERNRARWAELRDIITAKLFS